VPDITLILQVEKKVERAWIIRRGYAVITIGVNKSAPFIVDHYRLSRVEANGGGNSFLLKEFKESDFQNGQVIFVDKFLELSKNYVYTIEAIDCYGRVINYSAEGKQPVNLSREKIARPVIKRG
jgi:hypothetical protein